MSTTDRPNQLIITAWQRGDGPRQIAITLRNPTATWHGWRWDGQALTHPAKGAPTLRFTPAMTEEISRAVAAVTPEVAGKTEQTYGFAIKDGDREGWGFSHVENDAHGVYVRTAPGTPGVGKTVAFGKADVIEGA